MNTPYPMIPVFSRKTAGAIIPIARDYYMQLVAIDFVLGNGLHQINQAMPKP